MAVQKSKKSSSKSKFRKKLQYYFLSKKNALNLEKFKNYYILEDNFYLKKCNYCGFEINSKRGCFFCEYDNINYFLKNYEICRVIKEVEELDVYVQYPYLLDC